MPTPPVPSTPCDDPRSRARRLRARARRALLPVLLLGWCVMPCIPTAAAQGMRVWVPPSNDSASTWAADARARFRANTGDSVGGANFRPYDLVGQMSRRMLRTLGPNGLAAAPGLEARLDSLGLDVDVLADRAQPGFALVMVRNPFRFSAEAVGFLCWWYGKADLRMQGAVFRGGYDPASRVWWTGRPGRPYEWAVVDRVRSTGIASFTLFGLDPGGGSWSVVQSEARSPILGEQGETQFADLDHDGLPELLCWAVPATDSLFVPCSDCPRLMIEKTFVEHAEGFTLHDSRVFPSPYATFVTFIRLLLDDRRGEAQKLVADPALVTSAVAAGWAVSRKPDTWRVEYGEPGERWPQWLEMRFAGPQGVKRYIVHFGLREGRWVIQRWLEPQPAQRNPQAGAR